MLFWYKASNMSSLFNIRVILLCTVLNKLQEVDRVKNKNKK